MTDPIKVHYDLTALNPYKGNSIYAFEVISRIAADERIATLSVCVSYRNWRFFETLSRLPKIKLNIGAGSRLVEPRFGEQSGSPDLVHQVGGQVPIISRNWGVPLIVTIHDMNYRSLKRGIAWRAYKEISVWCMLARASGVIFISQAAYREFREKSYLSRRLSKIPHVKVIHNGISSVSPRCATTGNSGSDYWICFANQIHKRADISLRVVEKYNELTGDNARLVVIGEWLPNCETETIVDRRIGIDRMELSELLGNAKGLLFPSEYEGFGLPPLEAMKLGTPVIANKIPAVEEILQDACLWVNENNIEEFVVHLVKLERDFKYRERRVAMGLEHSEHFDWNKTARETVDSYIETLELKLCGTKT